MLRLRLDNSTLEESNKQLTSDLTKSQNTCEHLQTEMAKVSMNLENAEKTGKDTVKLKTTLEGERDKFREQRDAAIRALTERNNEKAELIVKVSACSSSAICDYVFVQLAEYERQMAELRRDFSEQSLRLQAELVRLREDLNSANMNRMSAEREVCVFTLSCAVMNSPMYIYTCIVGFSQSQSGRAIRTSGWGTHLLPIPVPQIDCH